ncbi:MAG: hypothetical protein JWL76_719 [Thermoleophilia bacterium]|nr:hypothetical protein [Thermoleophilia bacterium]
MDFSSVTTLLATSRGLATARWRQLATAIGLTAVLGAVLWFLLIKVAGGIGGDATSGGGMPSKGSLFMSITIAWAILVSAFVVPMAASTAAIADDGDDSPLGWTGGALRSLPWMWLCLAIPTLPLLLIGLWAVNDLLSAFSTALAGVAPESEAASSLASPMSFKVADFLFGSAPARWIVFSTVLGLWFMWSATRATGQDERAMPHAPWRLFGRNPLIVAALAGISAVALGPLLSKALSSLGGGLESVAGGAAEGGGDGASTMAVLIVGMVISAFIGVVAIPWIALFSDHDGLVARPDRAVDPDPATGVDPGLDAATHAAYASAHVAEPVQQAPAPVYATTGVPAAVHQVIDQHHVAGSGAPAGSWWYLQAGAHVTVQVASGHDTTSVSPVVSDAAGGWLGMHANGQPGAATVAIPAIGWYLLGAWNAGPQDAQVMMRFTLPMDAQPAPVDAAQQAAG